MADWYEDENKYAPCCCRCSVTTVMNVITKITVAFHMALLKRITSASIPTELKIFTVVALVLFSIPPCAAWYGIQKRKPFWLLPYMVTLVITVTGLFTTVAFLMFLAATEPDEGARIIWILWAVILAVPLLLNVWFVAVTRRCYQYL
ncbi:hypothetical protein QR680_015575 [Steinernema hermaphroditum]|uniref:Uncharacterized protein n=1 Tax=Steinernema hermaphroditum TaxID=289476 RepID=A0AA39H893_9BILA|nr:hypothetical protein QR680_015575 [Steinernema hermaphroditum]